jgi:hypothetical protein
MGVYELRVSIAPQKHGLDKGDAIGWVEVKALKFI